MQFFTESPGKGVASKSSALADVRTTYLRKYTYTADSSQTAINFVLPEAVSGYGSLPFLVVMGNAACIVGVSGGSVSSSLSTTGVSAANLLGEIAVRAIKENSKVRIKCTGTTAGVPITILSLRQGVTIENGWCSAS